MPGLFRLLLVVASLGLNACRAGTEAEPVKPAPTAKPAHDHTYKFRNPYYGATAWRLWFEDRSPVEGATLPRSGDILYPWDPDPAKAGLYLDYRRTAGQNDYAGFSDDVYVSQDNNHTTIANSWTGASGNAVSGIAGSLITATAPGPVAGTLGANFTSQSTTGMGHDIANGLAAVLYNEQYFYFADCLRAGPAHISFRDQTSDSSTDEYEALLPSIYNSVGSSGSEVTALAKLALAAGYLPREVKQNMKRAGIYPASLLYIWKAALPYNVPYDDELRHRVAYYSVGDHSDYTGSNQTTYNYFYHQYDDNLHMQNMVRIAKSMVYPPPVAILRKVRIVGGTIINDVARTSWLIRQAPGESVSIEVSPADSYDIYGLPLTFRAKLLYGDPDTAITEDPVSGDFRIFVPGTSGLPRGRTTVLLIANNGYFDSNPAAINVYRNRGKANLRPVISWPVDQAVLPGELLSLELTGADPEGFGVRFSQWAGEVGVLDGNTFRWSVPATQPEGDYRVHFIATDGTAGNSHESRELLIGVRSTVAEIGSNVSDGVAPLGVRFSADRSRDKAGGALTYAWRFGDGGTSSLANPLHVFSRPGSYRVTLTVTGASGTHSTATTIEARRLQ